MGTSWLYQALLCGLSPEEVAWVERVLAERGGPAPSATATLELVQDLQLQLEVC